MNDDEISVEAIERMAAKLGVPLTGTPRMLLPDLMIEDIPVGDQMHCRVHLIWKGRRIRSSNHSPGPGLDGLLAAAKRLGFKVTRIEDKPAR